MKRPSFQFYPGDWLNDAALRACSVGARGLWMDMLCLMHQGSDYGYLKVNHSHILTSNLARMIGATISDVEGWICELESFGVFSRDHDGCIMSRRMIRDEELRSRRAAGGVLGGNPALKLIANNDESKEKKVSTKVNVRDNLAPTPSSSSSSSSSLDKETTSLVGKPTIPATPFQSIVDLYHEILPELDGVRVLNADRKKKAASLWQWVMTSSRSDGSRRAETLEQGLDFMREYFSRARNSDWIMGRDAKSDGWKGDFDYLLSRKGLVRVVEKTR